METQVSNIFLSKWNQHKNKPLRSRPTTIPEQEAIHSGTLVRLTVS